MSKACIYSFILLYCQQNIPFQLPKFPLKALNYEREKQTEIKEIFKKVIWQKMYQSYFIVHISKKYGSLMRYTKGTVTLYEI